MYTISVNVSCDCTNEARRAETRRTIDALDLVASRPDGEQVDALDRILGDKPDIQVVPVATVNNGSG